MGGDTVRTGRHLRTIAAGALFAGAIVAATPAAAPAGLTAAP